MGRVKDLWVSEVPVKDAAGKIVRDDNGRVVTTKKKTAKHPDNGGNPDAKRWQAVWEDPDGNEKTKVFAKKTDAAAYWKKMEGDADRGEYIDPDAGKEKFGPLSRKSLRLKGKIGGRTRDIYETTLRLHVDPAFAHRSVRSIKPSEVAEWLQGPLIAPYGISVQETAFHLVSGTFALAVADKLRRDNPAQSDIVPVPQAEDREPREVWETPVVWQVIEGHRPRYRALAVCEAGLGLREGCAYGLAVDDLDFEAMKVSVRRQVARHGGGLVFKLPKGGKERTVPLSRGVKAELEASIEKFPPARVTLPWLNEDGTTGDPVTVLLLFVWDSPVHGVTAINARTYLPRVWYPALYAAGLTPPPERDKEHRLRYKSGGRETGQHTLRHYFETTLDDGAVSLAGQMEFLGHSRKSKVITTGVYGHVTEKTFQTARDAVDGTLFRLRPLASGGTVAELRAAQ